jgi:hypothetical protein
MLMTRGQAVEVVVSALPDPGHIKDWDLSREDSIRFRWRHCLYRFGFATSFIVEEVDGVCLASTDRAELMEKLLKRTYFEKELARG